MRATAWPGWTSRRARRRTQIHGRDRPAHPGGAGQAAAGWHGRWTGPLIAAELGDVDVQYVWRFLHVWRFLRMQKIDLAARKSWCESNDPAFAAKTTEIVGLYLDPPDGALVLAVDEKPSIQALERAQDYLKLPNGRALTSQSHDYTRHSTTTLFAALNIASGEVAVHQNAQQQRRMIGRRTRAAITLNHRRQVQPVNHVNDKPS
jgi:hypothetical protein